MNQDNMVNSNKISASVAAEVLIALNYSHQDIINKIPHPLIKELEEISDKDYKIEIDESKSLSEQNLMPESFDVLAGIYLKYCASEETKKRFYSKTKLSSLYDTEAEHKLENEEKIEKSEQAIEPIVNTNNEENNEDNINDSSNSNSDSNNNNVLPEVKKESWIKRLFRGIISMFVR